jgi:hypothetical protein
MQPDEAACQLDEVLRGRAARQEVPSPEPSAALLDGNSAPGHAST